MMSFRAKVIKVMIAAPGDILGERESIRHILQEWNYAHAEDKNIVLMPVGWESHATPSVGDRPQAIINKQVLASCDLLAAVFWNRLGTPTGKAISGTVEEIEKHVKAKKPAMIYFSLAPVQAGIIDKEQFEALQVFKEEMSKRGLYAEYKTSEEFREKFSRHLAQTVNRYFASKKNGNVQSHEEWTAAPLKLPEISNRAKWLLIEAAKDKEGVVVWLRGKPGLAILTHGMNLAESHDPKIEARWDSALQELRKFSLLEDRVYKNELFSVTQEGYRVADLLGEWQYAIVV